MNEAHCLNVLRVALVKKFAAHAGKNYLKDIQCHSTCQDERTQKSAPKGRSVHAGQLQLHLYAPVFVLAWENVTSELNTHPLNHFFEMSPTVDGRSGVS